MSISRIISAPFRIPGSGDEVIDGAATRVGWCGNPAESRLAFKLLLRLIPSQIPPNPALAFIFKLKFCGAADTDNREALAEIDEWEGNRRERV